MIVAGALAAAHEHHVVHGDVRPGHLLVAPSGEPVLGGFGLSALAADPASGAPLPAHAAPEIVEGRSGQAASDLYSLGSTLVTLLTGYGPEAALVDFLNRADEPAGRSALPPGADGRPLPEGVVGVLARMTATDSAGATRGRSQRRTRPARSRGGAEPSGARGGFLLSSLIARGRGRRRRVSKSLEPKLSVLFDAWDTPAVTPHRLPQREPVPVVGAVAPVRVVPPADIGRVAGGTVPAAGGTVPAAGGTVPAAGGTVPAAGGTVVGPACASRQRRAGGS